MDILRTLPWKSRSPLPVPARGEILLLESRHHWMKRAPAFCVWLILSVICLVAMLSLPAGSAAGGYGSVVAVAALLIVHHWFFHAMLSESATGFMLTNKRVLFLWRRLWLADEMDELVLQKIKLVKAHRRGFIRQILDYGDLACLFDIDAGKTLLYLPHPGEWARRIEKMIDIT